MVQCYCGISSVGYKNVLQMPRVLCSCFDTVIGEINAGFNYCVLSSFRALIYICCLKIVVFAHDYMLYIGNVSVLLLCRFLQRICQPWHGPPR